jgi:hypothetical protein
MLIAEVENAMAIIKDIFNDDYSTPAIKTDAINTYQFALSIRANIIRVYSGRTNRPVNYDGLALLRVAYRQLINKS